MSTDGKIRTKPSEYNTFSFHAVRTISALSAVVVTAIIVFFCIELKNDGYKIPWTFLIILAASVITLIWLLLTSFIHCCGRLSPLFNMFINVPLLLVWLVGLGLLTYGIYGTLSHSCTKINWGNNDGITICQQYKALFSFVIFGTMSQFALIVLDVRARIAQTRSGRYAKMQDVKLEPFDSTHSHNLSSTSVHDNPYTAPSSGAAYRDEPGWRPGQRTNDYGDIAGQEGQQFRMGQFDEQYAPAHQTGYDRGYGNNGNVYGPRY